MKLKTLVCCLGLLSIGVDLYADNALQAYRLGQYKEAAAEFMERDPQDVYGRFYWGEMNLYGYGIAKDNDKAIQSYQLAAEKGFLPAQQMMARYALLIQKNPEEALAWFKKAAENQDVLAMMYCAGAYMYGYGVNKNEDTARKYYIAAAKLGNPLAQTTLAEHFFDTKHGKNNTLAVLWLNKAVAQNDISGLMLKAKMLYADEHYDEAQMLVNQAKNQHFWPAYYLQGQWAMDAKNYIIAHRNLFIAAQHGYTPAQLALADLYLLEGTKFYHPHYAFLWVLHAAQKQEIFAQKRLSDMYREGVGTEPNQELAKQWLAMSQLQQKRSPEDVAIKLARWLSYEKYTDFSQGDYRLNGIWFDWHNPKALKQAQMNNAPKFFELNLKNLFQPKFEMVNPKDIAITEYLDAILRYQGPLAASDFNFPHNQDYLKQPLNKIALKQLKHQAYLGVVGAQFILAQAYEHGVGLKQDLPKAKIWYQKAVLQNDLRAQYELALMQLNDADIAQKKQALHQLRDAAFKGDALSEYVYGLISEQGVKTEDGKVVQAADLDEAKSMLMLAAVNQSGLAKFRLAEWISREENKGLSAQAKAERYDLLKQLYRGAVKDGVRAAELPLAFYEATSKNPKNREWAYQIANHYAAEDKLEAVLLMGLISAYEQGNSRVAKTWFEKAKPHPIGAFIWASYEKDPLLQQALLEKSAKADFPYAYLNLAILKQQQNQSPFEDLEKSVALQNRSASHLLANLWVLQDDAASQEQARKIFEQLALQGDTDAEWKLGYLMAKGIGGLKDTQVAGEWLTKSAQTSADAQMLLAYLSHLGELGQTPNDDDAKKWFELAAAKIPKAWIGLGFVYETVDKNYTDARLAYEHAIGQEQTLANYNLGLIYEYGKGVPVDVTQAQKYFLASAQRGAPHAMIRLAHAYLGGGEHGFYAHEALAWLQKAAAKGQVDAWYEMGLMHEAGVATRLNFDEAKKNYQMAANLGDERAIHALERLNHHRKALSVSHNKSFNEAFNGNTDGPQMQYLLILDRLNHQEALALTGLKELLISHPNYAPAKHLWLSMRA